MKVKKGDNVKILSGKDRNKTGKILKVSPKDNNVVVDGLNLVIKHRKAKNRGEKGQRISLSAPMDASRVQLICPKCGKPTRIGYRELKDKKVRCCKKCKAEIQ